MDLSTGREFHDRLSEFCEVYSNLGMLSILPYICYSYFYVITAYTGYHDFCHVCVTITHFNYLEFVLISG